MVFSVVKFLLHSMFHSISVSMIHWPSRLCTRIYVLIPVLSCTWTAGLVPPSHLEVIRLRWEPEHGKLHRMKMQGHKAFKCFQVKIKRDSMWSIWIGFVLLVLPIVILSYFKPTPSKALSGLARAIGSWSLKFRLDDSAHNMDFASKLFCLQMSSLFERQLGSTNSESMS